MPKKIRCEDCGHPLTKDEIEHGDKCNDCLRIWIIKDNKEMIDIRIGNNK